MGETGYKAATWLWEAFLVSIPQSATHHTGHIMRGWKFLEGFPRKQKSVNQQ